MTYQHLPGMPVDPPGYIDDHGGSANTQEVSASIFEQFEIEDEAVERDSFMVRASLMTKKFVYGFSSRVVHPVSRLIDPMYELYKFLYSKYEVSVQKIGNPLVVNRLLYVFSIMIIMFFVSRYSSRDGVNGSSGGAFSQNELFDRVMLGDSIKSKINTASMKENLEYLSSMPHIAGTRGDLALARYVESLMNSNGLRHVLLEELQASINYPQHDPKKTYVSLGDGSWSATLNELHNNDMHYLAYNPNSLATNDPQEGTYYYANYGTPSDFEKLQANDIQIKDSILLIRYGGDFPEANKVQLAHEHGVRAVVFITPQFELGKKGNAEKVDDVIQRQGVGRARVSPGDVLTPGWSSQDGFVTRLPWFKSETTPKIPTIPISYLDGEKLLARLEKSGASFGDYHSGVRSTASDRLLRVLVGDNEWMIHQIWNVVGSIEGREQSQQAIIIGAGRDAGCFGTMGANTGTVVLIEMMKVFTALQRQWSWSPLRLIHFVLFDATNYNLAGSTEWVESTKELLMKQGYTYIDLSDAIAGNDLQVQSHPFLSDVINQALSKVKQLDKKSLLEVYRSKHGDKFPYEMLRLRNYLPFINFVNMPAIEIRFTGYKYPENSCYDSFERFESAEIDPKMEKHAQLVEVLSLVALELAESPIIPFNFLNLVARVEDYKKDMERYINEMIEAGSKKARPTIHYEGLANSINILESAARAIHKWYEAWANYLQESADMEPSMLALNRWKWNENLIRFNEYFIQRQTKPKRAGYRNVLFGVSYAAPVEAQKDHSWNSFPQVRDNAYSQQYGEVQKEIDNLANAIAYAAEQVTRIQ